MSETRPSDSLALSLLGAGFILMVPYVTLYNLTLCFFYVSPPQGLPSACNQPFLAIGWATALGLVLLCLGFLIYAQPARHHEYGVLIILTTFLGVGLLFGPMSALAASPFIWIALLLSLWAGAVGMKWRPPALAVPAIHGHAS